jgi:hypothetical protein
MNPSPFRLSIVSGAPLLAAAVLMLGGCSPSPGRGLRGHTGCSPDQASKPGGGCAGQDRRRRRSARSFVDRIGRGAAIAGQGRSERTERPTGAASRRRCARRSGGGGVRAAAGTDQAQDAPGSPARAQGHADALAGRCKQGAADLQSVDEAVQALRDAQSEVDIAAAEVTVAKRKAEQLRACCSATSCVRPRPASWCACWPRAAACCKAAAPWRCCCQSAL